MLFRSEKATAWERPEDPRQLLRDRQPQTYRFKDDGLIPNHPKWPLVIYKSVVRLPQSLDPAAVFEELFEKNGLGGDSWRDGIYDYVHYQSSRAATAGFSLSDLKVARSS